MRKIETEILFRPHYLAELTGEARGKSNAAIFKEESEKKEALEIKAMEQAQKVFSAKQALELLEPEKDNYTPARTGAKSPAEKHAEAGEKLKKEQSKLEEINKKLEEVLDRLPELEAKKDKVTLSETAKKRLTTIAIEIKYKRRKRLLNKYVLKGLRKEEEGGEIYSEFTGEALVIEKERKKNDWFTGETDIRKHNKAGEVIEITDIKNRYDLDTLEDRRGEEMDRENKCQLLGYLDLYPTAKVLKVANVLCSNDFQLINDEIRGETYRTRPDELTATGELKDARIIEIAKESIYTKEEFLEFLALKIDAEKLGQLIRGNCEDLEAQKVFNDFIELDIEERVIEQVLEVTEKEWEELERIKKYLQASREYLAEVYNIHHVKKAV